MSVISSRDTYVDEVKDRLMSLYKQLHGGCNDHAKILLIERKLRRDLYVQDFDKWKVACDGLEKGCTLHEKVSKAYKEVLACVEEFWWYKGKLGSNVPVWQQGWVKWEMSADDALRVIEERVKPRLEAAGKEDGGIENWYLRSLIETELAYIETGWTTHVGHGTKQDNLQVVEVEPQEEQTEHKVQTIQPIKAEGSMRMHNLLSMLGKCV
jgi:hypothetical protein